MPEVKSSNIRSVDYNDDARELTVSFKTGATYVYAEVPRSVYDALVSADSIGGYFASRVRGKYESIKLEPAHAEARRETAT